MKKQLIIAGMVILGLVSCDKKEPKIVEEAQISTDFVEEHTAKNSLDWNGNYQGTLPCADCEGIITTIVLNSDGTFFSKEEYQKESVLIVENKGKFTWDSNGTEISLEGEGNEFKRYFKVVEGAIIHLDDEGNEITGDLEQHYRLTKIN